MVPLPPTLNWPKRANGAEQMVIFEVIFRITVTDEGSAGTSFEDIQGWYLTGRARDEREKGIV